MTHGFIRRGFSTAEGHRTHKTGRFTEFASHLVILLLVVSGVFSLVQKNFHSYLLSSCAAGSSVACWLLYRWLTRNERARKRAWTDGEDPGEVELGGIWRFTRTLPGKIAMFLLWGIFMAAMLAVLVHTILECPPEDCR